MHRDTNTTDHSERFTPVHKVGLFIWFVCTIGLFSYILTLAYQGGPTLSTAQPGSPIYLRGGMFAMIRLPSTITPRQEVVIYDDGTANRGLNPPQPDQSRQIVLSATEIHDIAQLQAQWCREIPTFPMLLPDEPFYDVGFRCDQRYHVKQAQVPVDMLPPALETLIARIPALSAP